MKISKLLPTAFLVTALVGAGAVVATAQDQTPAPEAPSETPLQAQPEADRPAFRADFRRGHGHQAGFGGRSGSQTFVNLFGEVDADANGSVTQEEIDAFRAAEVTGADASGDGALQIEEFDTLYREYTRSRMVDAFQELDANGDGAISTQEMDSRFGGIVDRMDRDDDGALTLQDRGRRG